MKPRPCRYDCGQEVVLAQLPSGTWFAFSIEPVPYTMIHPDLPAIAWRPTGDLVDAHTALRPPRQAYPIHLCRPYRESLSSMQPLGASILDVYSTITTTAAAS